MGALLLEVSGLTVAIDTPAGPIHPVRDVSLRVQSGETLAIVGEGGSGKSLLGLSIIGLLPPVASELPSFSNSTEHLAEDRLCRQHMGELVDQGP